MRSDEPFSRNFHLALTALALLESYVQLRLIGEIISIYVAWFPDFGTGCQDGKKGYSRAHG